MQNFRCEQAQLNGNTAIVGAVGKSYRVVLPAERIDGKKITEAEGPTRLYGGDGGVSAVHIRGTRL